MIGAAVLAAGASKRLGSPKQLLQINGVSFVRHAALCALGSVDRVAVVVGSHASRVQESVAGLSLEILENPSWSEGIAASIRLAASWAARNDLEAVLLLLADQPKLQASHLQRLVARFRRTHRPVGSGYAGIVGAPALLPWNYFAALGELSGDRGAAQLLRTVADVGVVPWPAGTLDVDTERAARPFR